LVGAQKEEALPSKKIGRKGVQKIKKVPGGGGGLKAWGPERGPEVQPSLKKKRGRE